VKEGLRDLTVNSILQKLAARHDPRGVEGMARFGIVAKKVYGGWPLPALRKLAREIGPGHALAQELWASEIYEARMLAIMIEEPEKVDARQMERWTKDFDNWAVCDGACIHLFRYTRFAHAKCVAWSSRREEFVKRAGFSLMAGLAVADKVSNDRAFLKFLPLIKRAAGDERNFVRKSVNWALRQIGKRNSALNRAAIAMGREILLLDSPAARWIAADALRELQSPAVQQRFAMRRGAISKTKVRPIQHRS
jgi:3-methyladenine DNA glycosylase AlkD